MTTKKIVIPKNFLHPNQWKIYLCLARFIIVVAGRRFGKTRVAAAKLVIAALQKVGVYWWVSPTWAMGTPAWRIVKKLLKKTIKNIKVTETTRTIELYNGSIIEFRSADHPDSLRGEGLSGLVIDECAQIKEEVWTQSLRPSLTDKLGWVIFIGTPKGHNWFFTLYHDHENSDNIEWKTFQFTSYDNPYLSRKEIDDAKEDISDDEFAQEYLAEFISEHGAIFKREWFIERHTKNYVPVGRWISIDTGLLETEPSSKTAIVVGEITSNYYLALIDVWSDRVAYPQLIDTIIAMARKHNTDGKLQGIIIENKGNGTPAIQTLGQMLNFKERKLIVKFNPTVSKNMRKNSASVWCEKGMVLLPHPSNNYQWLFSFENDLFMASNDENEDVMDAFSQLVINLSKYLAIGHRKSAR